MDPEIEVSTLGRCDVGGSPVSSRRAVELAALLAMSGGRAQRDWLMVNLFEGAPAPSSLPTLALRARKAGLPVRYERTRGYFWIEDHARFDVVELLRSLRSGQVDRALDLYAGPFLPTSNSPFAMEARAEVENAVVRAVLDSGNVDLMVRADRVVKHPELSEELVARSVDPTAVSLSRSWLSGLGVAG